MTEEIDRIRAALADRYAVARELGAGGMATVYLAEDLKHHRKVALKVLRPDLAATLGPERFIREITVAANLQHPHVLPLYDSGEAGGFLFFVMPYVDGLSLRQKLIREGELPISDAARILRDVADALAYSHQQGVVHRDIKPENVMLSGRHALVTDFGVAKAVSEATGRHQLTTAGVALGTPTYMAPEQATADPHTDHRADIYAFGAVAYELLTGQPPFVAPTPQAVLAAHVTTAVTPVTSHRESIPPALAALVMRCLQKKPADRYQSADEMIPVLEQLLTPSGGITPTHTAPHMAAHMAALSSSVLGTRSARLLIAAVVVLVVALGVYGIMKRAPAPIMLGQTVQVTLDPGLELYPALSPDGRVVAFTAGPAGSRRVFVKSVTGGSAVQVTRDPAGDHVLPRWSPDGSQLLFFGRGGIYVVPALGGQLRIVVANQADGGVAYAAWSPDGSEIVYVEGTLAVRDTARIYRRRLDGGEPRLVTQDIEVHSPVWSPDGHWIAYVSGNSRYNFGGQVLGNLGPSAVYVVNAGGGPPIPVTDRQYLHTSPAWMPDSKSLLVVSSRGGGRDVYRLRLGRTGTIGEPERVTTGLSAGSISVSRDGTQLAYTRFTNDANVWSLDVPSTGIASVRNAVPVTRGSQHIEGLSVSADGQWLAFDSDRAGNADIWKVSLTGGEPIQLTTDLHDDFIPQWSPDGRRIAFHSWRSGNRDVFVVQADGQGEERVTSDSSHEYYPAWAPDGRQLVFYSNVTTKEQLFTTEQSASGWSDPHQITVNGGTQPKWSPNGRSIAFGSAGGNSFVDAGGGNERVLRTTLRFGPDSALPAGREWASDSRSIFVKGRSTDGYASLWLVPVDGATPRLLVRFDDPSRPSSRQEFAVVGRKFFFTVEDRQSDVFVASIRPQP